MATIAIPTTARLSHLQDDLVYEEEIPYEIWADNVPDGIQRTNVKLNIVPDCPLTDVRSLAEEDRPELETFGFQWMHQDFPHQAGISRADDVSTATQEQRYSLDRYLDTMSAFLREKVGCERVMCWDWRVFRRQFSASVVLTDSCVTGQTVKNDSPTFDAEYLYFEA
jgi:hypothetical protein